MCRVHALVAVAVIIAVVAAGGPSFADGSLTSPSVPPDPTPGQVEQNVPDLANPLNKPITGGSEDPLVVGTRPPPSLESLQAIRPDDEKGDGLEPGRADMLHTAALTYGAQGGLAARSFAINEMLRRYQTQLDQVFNITAGIGVADHRQRHGANDRPISAFPRVGGQHLAQHQGSVNMQHDCESLPGPMRLFCPAQPGKAIVVTALRPPVGLRGHRPSTAVGPAGSSAPIGRFNASRRRAGYDSFGSNSAKMSGW